MIEIEELQICLQEKISQDEYNRSLENPQIAKFYDWVFENNDQGNLEMACVHLKAILPFEKEFPMIISFAKMFIG